MVKKIIIFVILSLVCIPNVLAVCENDELNDWAENVKVSFINEEYREELIFEDGTIIPEYVPKYDYILTLEPMRDDIYMKVTDNLSKKTVTISNEGDNYYDKVIGSMVHFDKKLYTIDIYVKKNAKVCANEKLRTLTYEVEPYNMYGHYKQCEKNPDADICQSYKDTSDVTEEEFLEFFGEDVPKDKDDNILLIILKEYWYSVLVPIVLISIFYIIRIKKLRKQQEYVDRFEDDEDNDNTSNNNLNNSNQNNNQNDSGVR